MVKPKIILGIETSCDETAAAVVENTKDGVKILSNIVASSATLQAKYGGIIPEQAAREQLKSIIPVIQESLQVSGYSGQEIDTIAVTEGPGLIGSLLVGVETAKILATVWNKPLVPINHLIGHFYANWIVENQESRIKNQASKSLILNSNPLILPSFPCIGLLVSGGHTDLVLFKDHGKYDYLGGTRDDAAGEAFDKSARLLGLPYPGGPVISKLAEKGDPQAFKLPRPLIDSDDFDFSFSGLKTAIAKIVSAGGAEETCPPSLRSGVSRRGSQASTASSPKANEDAPEKPKRQDPRTENLAASIQEAIIDVLVAKTLKAALTFKVKQILVAGGVAANRKLKEKFAVEIQEKLSHVRLFIPPPNLCTDNAAYIGAAAFYNYHPIDPLTLQANPNLSLS